MVSNMKIHVFVGSIIKLLPTRDEATSMRDSVMKLV